MRKQPGHEGVTDISGRTINMGVAVSSDGTVVYYGPSQSDGSDECTTEVWDGIDDAFPGEGDLRDG